MTAGSGGFCLWWNEDLASFALVFVARNGKITAVIEYREDRDIEDYLLERISRFRDTLDKVRRERKSMSLAAHRHSRGI